MASILDDVVSGLKRGTGSLVQQGAAVANDLGIDASGARAYGDRLVSENPAKVASIADAVANPREAVTEAVSGMAPAAATTIGASAVGSGIGALVDARFGTRGLGRAAGGIAGAYLSDLAQNYGQNRLAQEQSGVEDKTRAGIAAVGQAALGQLPIFPAVRRLSGLGTPEGGIAREAISNAVLGAASAPATVALTRAAAHQDLANSEALDEYGLAAGQGGIAGATIAGVSHGTQKLIEGARTRADEVTAKNEAAAEAAKPKKENAAPEPDEVPYAPPSLAELAPRERLAVDRALNPTPLTVDASRGPLSRSVVKGADEGVIEGIKPIRFSKASPNPDEPAFDLSPASGTRRVKVGDSAITYTSSDDGAHVVLVQTPEKARGQGSARAAMQRLTADADAQGKPITLNVSPIDSRVDEGRLQGFYESLGFKPAGKTDQGDVSMVREPTRPPFVPTDIRPPTDSVRDVASATFNHPRIGAEATVPIDSLSGGVRMNDSRERSRVDQLAKQISGPDGYLSRLIVDDEGNVLEGQHRLEALRQLGAKDVPVTRVNDLMRGFPEAEIKTALNDGSLKSDHVNQFAGHIADAYKEAAGDVSKIRQEYEVPKGFEKQWNAGLDALETRQPVVQSSAETNAGIQNATDTGTASASRRESAAESEGLRVDGGLRGSGRLASQSDVGSPAPVRGLPQRFSVEGRKLEVGPHAPAIAAAKAYSEAAGIPYRRQASYVPVDEAKAKRIADAFEKMPHAPNDPQVRQAYEAMVGETLAQWDAIKKTGLKVEFIKPGQRDPYAKSPRLATDDVRNNNHLWVFPSDQGFGGPASAHVDVSGNPLLKPTGETIGGHKILANDIFRIVHDYFGHIKEGFGFRADGEENAYQSHARMYSPLARRAMATETRGQNSWVNFGPFGDRNKSASAAETEYAPQKIGLLPEEFAHDLQGGDEEAGGPQARASLSPAARAESGADGSGRSEEAIQRAASANPVRSGSLAPIRVQELADRQTKNWKGGPAVSVVATAADLPAAVRNAPGFDAKSVDGVYDGSGRIFLVSDRIASARDVRRLIAHEAYAHYGVNGVLGDKMPEFLTKVQGLKDTDDDVRAAAQRVFEKYGQLEPQVEAEEIVAHLAENYQSLGGRAKIMVAQVIAAIKRFINDKLNIKQDWSHADILSMIAKAKRTLEQSPDAAKRTAAAARASVTADPFYSALTRSVVGAKGAPKAAGAKAWREWLDGAQRRGEFKGGEREWLGLDAWLDSKQGNVSRDEIADYVRAQSVKLDETRLGSPQANRDSKYFLPEVQRAMRDSGGEADDNMLLTLSNDGDAYRALTKRFPELANDDEWASTVLNDIYGGSMHNDTQYGQYTLNGGDNYREVLMQLPQKPIPPEGRIEQLQNGLFRVDATGGITSLHATRGEAVLETHRLGEIFNKGKNSDDNYRSSHFKQQPNIVAHLRLNDRLGPKGEKVLHIEEIQSDWHQEGRKKGYKGSVADPKYTAEKVDGKYGGYWIVRDEHGHEIGKSSATTEAQAIREYAQSAKADAVPDAPFKKDWHMLAFKRALREAVDGGYDRLTWTTGDTQNERYDLSKHVDSLRYDPVEQRIMGYKKARTAGIEGDRVIDQRGVTPEKLVDFVGKDAAEKLLASSLHRGQHHLNGAELKIGGSGMKGFYDRMLPSDVGKYVKQWGGKVGEETLKLGSPYDKRAESAKVHSLDITPAMRESVQAGQPMFSRTPATAESFDGWTRPSDKLDRYLATSARERINAYMKVAGQKADQLRTIFQDYFLPVRRVQEAIEARGGTIGDDSNVYGREELYYGRTGSRLQKLEEDHVKPLVAAMAKSGVSQQDLELYLYAKFAPERNARIAKINDKLPDGGSGMTNADASKVLADFDASGQSAKLKELADRVYAMNELRVAALEDAGLIGKEEAATWREDKHYVPLKGFAEGTDDDQPTRPAIGAGFSVGGKEAWRALGRRTRAADIVANAVAQTNQAIIRAEKNRVAQSLLKLAQENPNPELWNIDKQVSKPSFNRSTGEVEYTKRDEPDAVVAKVDGEEHRISIYDRRLLESMKNMGAAKVGAILRSIASINRFLALTRTTLAPEFVLSNLARDFQEASVNLTGKLGAKEAARAAADIPTSIKAMWGQTGGKKVGGEWARWAQEFADAGGMTSFVTQRTVEEQQAKIQSLLRDANGGTVASMRKVLNGTGDLIERVNNTIENATRLSAYVQGRRAGLSTDQAARLAKNLTVNFNRKGSAGAAMNAMYLFYNASIQGSARFLHALKSPKVQGLMGAVAATGFSLGYYNRMVGGKDEDGEDAWDKVPDYEKQRNLIVMNAFGQGTRLKIPMPYTYNLPYLAGMAMADSIFGKKPASSGAASMVNALIGSFNPIGDFDITKDPTTQTVKLASPSALQPFIDLAFNRNHFGSPITPEGSPFDKVPKPDSQRFYPSTNPGAVWLSNELNKLTGGNQVRPGAIDVSPASMTYLFDYLTGGTGSFVERAGTAAALAAKGEPVPISKVPFARVFAGALDDRRVNDTFYRLRDEVNQKAALGKLIAKPGALPDATQADRSDGKFGLRLATPLAATERELKKINEAITFARSKDDDAKVKQLQEVQRRIMLSFNKAYFRVKEITPD